MRKLLNLALAPALLTLALALAGCIPALVAMAASDDDDEPPPPAQAAAAPTPETCGNGTCDGTETHQSCPTDCGPPRAPGCGDGVCDMMGGESAKSCALDCGDRPGPADDKGITVGHTPTAGQPIGTTQPGAPALDPAQASSAGLLGAPCSCIGQSNSTIDCAGMSTGCHYEMMGADNYSCFVNHPSAGKGFCTQSCTGANDTSCPNGGQCVSFPHHAGTGEEYWRCR